MNLSEQILQILYPLTDPSTGLNLKQMNLKYQFECSENSIDLKIRAGFPCLSWETKLQQLISTEIHKHFPQFSLKLSINQFIRAHKTQFTGLGLRGIKNTLAIASGKGGVGKSTLTLNLAAALAKLGARVGILDADLYGPSMPLMLGVKEPLQTSGDSYLPISVHQIQTMSLGYLAPEAQALIWRGPMLAKSLIQMINLTLWDDLDYLLIDLPPGTGDIQLTLVQKIPLTAALVVTTPQNIATLDAQKAIHMFQKTGIDVLGLVENMSTHLCTHCGHAEPIFGSGGAEQLCQTYKIPLLGQLPLDGRVRKHCDEGTPTALQKEDELGKIFIEIALRSAIELANKAINYADKLPGVQIE